jgi:putative MATE family efflux protein
MLQVNRSSLWGPASFYREALSIALPVMLQQLIMSMVSLIDNFMVAGLGDAKMAAINVANQINFVYMIILLALCNAGGVYLSQYRGAGNEEGMRQAYRFKVVMALAVSAAYLVLCQAIPHRLMAVMTMGNAAQGEIVSHGVTYMRIVSAMWLPYAISSAIGTALRDTGKVKPSLVISVAATGVNTFLNWVLIYGNLGAPRLEVAGAAIATDLARLVELLCFVVYARARKPSFYVPPARVLRIRLSLFREILSRSTLMLLSELTWIVSETVTTALYNGRGGAEVVAGMAAGWAIGNLFMLVFGGIQVSATVIVGGSLGANRLDEARDRARWIQSGSVVAGVVVTILATSSLLIIPVVFGNLTPSARTVARGLIAVIAVYLPLWALLNAQYAVSRSGGDMMMGFLADAATTFIIFLPAAFLLALFTPIGPVALYALVKTSDFLKLGVARWWLKKEKWVRNLAQPLG